MKMTIDANYFYEHQYYGGSFSHDACAALLDYYDGIDSELEFDPCAIHCEWVEYSDGGDGLTYRNFIADHGYLLDRDEWNQDNPDGDDDDYINDLLDLIETSYATVIRLDNSFLISQ